MADLNLKDFFAANHFGGAAKATSGQDEDGDRARMLAQDTGLIWGEKSWDSRSEEGTRQHSPVWGFQHDLTLFPSFAKQNTPQIPIHSAFLFLRIIKIIQVLLK